MVLSVSLFFVISHGIALFFVDHAGRDSLDSRLSLNLGNSRRIIARFQAGIDDGTGIPKPFLFREGATTFNETRAVLNAVLRKVTGKGE